MHFIESDLVQVLLCIKERTRPALCQTSCLHLQLLAGRSSLSKLLSWDETELKNWHMTEALDIYPSKSEEGLYTDVEQMHDTALPPPFFF